MVIMNNPGHMNIELQKTYIIWERCDVFENEKYYERNVFISEKKIYI